LFALATRLRVPGPIFHYICPPHDDDAIASVRTFHCWSGWGPSHGRMLACLGALLEDKGHCAPIDIGQIQDALLTPLAASARAMGVPFPHDMPVSLLWTPNTSKAKKPAADKTTAG
jgi:hypothetical protein